MFSSTNKKTSNENLNEHYNKHVQRELNSFGKITKEQYEQIAFDLAKRPIDNKIIFGYEINRYNRWYYNKYNKITHTMVAYYYNNKNKPCIVNCYKTNFGKFMRRKERFETRDIPGNR